MIAQEIVDHLAANTLCIWNAALMNKEYYHVFATDLMSDALAMINNSFDQTVLVTGICNSQSLRTAEMLDIEFIIYVRGKKPNQEVIQLAKEMGFNIFYTDYTMFEASGILYQMGMKPCVS